MFFAQLSHAMLLPQNIQSPVAADREEPLGQVIPDRSAILGAEAQERVLHHVMRLFRIAQQTSGVQPQRSLEAANRLANPGAVLGVRFSCHHHTRKGMKSRCPLLRMGREFLRNRAPHFLVGCHGRVWSSEARPTSPHCSGRVSDPADRSPDLCSARVSDPARGPTAVAIEEVVGMPR